MSRKYSLLEIIIGICTIVACFAAVLVVPEVRVQLGLDGTNSSEKSAPILIETAVRYLPYLLIILMIGILLWLLRNATQPIRWDFSGFLGMSAVEGKDIHVARFQAKGFNESKQNFRKVSGYIESNINGERIPILLDSMPPEDTNGIPPKGDFWIGALFRDPTALREGIQAEKFLQRFSDFTFVLYLGNKKYEQRFSRNVVERRITSFWKESNPNPRPSITKKNG